MHGDVFRPPSCTMLLSVFVGSGSQLVFMTLIALGEPWLPQGMQPQSIVLFSSVNKLPLPSYSLLSSSLPFTLFLFCMTVASPPSPPPPPPHTHIQLLYDHLQYLLVWGSSLLPTVELFSQLCWWVVCTNDCCLHLFMSL